MRGLVDAREPHGDVGTDPRVDTVAYLTVWLVLLFGINARQVVGIFGAIGSPALLMGLTALFLWVAGWILPGSGLDRRPHPLRPALLVYLWVVMASAIVAFSRPLSDLEASGAVRALLTSLVLVGIALLVADGVQSVSRLQTLLRRVTIATAAVSGLGVLQFVSGRALQFTVPGLQWNAEILGTAERSIFHRPAGTTLHPIEFSVITAAMLPLAIHFALYGTTRTIRRNMAVAAFVIVLGVPLSISRSGLVALVVALAVASLAWSWRRRLQALLLGMIAVPVLWMGVPGLIGTLIGLFSNTDADISIQARLDRTPRIMALVRERPWLGLGNGTWSVEDYFLVDNEVWVTTLEMGILGALLTFALFGAAILIGVLIKYLPGVEEGTGHLAHATAACIAAITVSFATFDAFHYPMLTGTLFLLLGAVGALWRLHDGIDSGRALSKARAVVTR
jgi:O-antigen ligase